MLSDGRHREGLDKRRCGFGCARVGVASLAYDVRFSFGGLEVQGHCCQGFTLVGGDSNREQGSRGGSSCESGKMRKPGWGMSFCLTGRGFYAFNRDSTVILFQEHRSLEVSCWFPHVVAFGVS